MIFAFSQSIQIAHASGASWAYDFLQTDTAYAFAWVG